VRADQQEILLQLTGVTKTFPGIRALSQVSFDVVAGEVHGLVGENGAGKSTLMGVASGALLANDGIVRISGQEMRANPEQARMLGLSIVRQEPALMPDLTVAENIYLGLPESKRPSLSGLNDWATGLLEWWGKDVAIGANETVATLNPEQRFIVEIVKALASSPKVLVLDEPTEHLVAKDVERLFARIREVTAKGAAVVYISHRIREVQVIAQRITVLRDGEGQGTYNAADLSEDKIVSLIVGEDLDRTFPPKTISPGAVVLQLEDFSGPGFDGVDLEVRSGEIVGLAGIDGNGQRELMRALAGLSPSRGAVSIGGKTAVLHHPGTAMGSGITYLSGDRHHEGIFADLTVRENFSSRSIAQDLVAGIVRKSSEQRRTKKAVDLFAVKTPTIETTIKSLSGGNQQKLILSSVLATNPKVLLVDEPTQGVDVGARAEIYKVLRNVAEKGVAILLVSSDAQEVAGLSERVAIFSRGRIVETLGGDAVAEDNITSAVLKSTSIREKAHKLVSPVLKWASGNIAPLVMVLAAILLLGAAAFFYNPFYASGRNIMGIATLAATMALVAYGQQTLLLVGGIDLSVGPLMGLCMVVASFFLLENAPPDQFALGIALIFAVALCVGFANWFLVDPLGMHPMVATLATFMAVQAVAMLLRPVPDGMIDGALMTSLKLKLGFIPVAFILAVILAFVLEYVLYKRPVGLKFRGLGSRTEAARVAGIKPVYTRLLAYLACSTLTALAAITMIPQVGVGDPRAGIGYTLTSIAAAVIGGASLFGGRGSFVGCLLGAIFITQINSVTAFLALDQAWQNYLLGGLILLAVAFYSKSRQLAVAS
jgi:ribose transport system ATP-binding protein